MGKNQIDNYPEHALFPATEEDQPAPEVAFIQVIRHEDGRSKQIPRVFRADEIRDLSDIFNLWGGGIYELWGRGRSVHDPDRQGRINANRRYEIAGPSKPLMVDGSNDVAPARAAPVAVAPSSSEVPTTMLQLVPIFAGLWTQAQQAREAREDREAQRRRDEEERRRQDDIRREERARAEMIQHSQNLQNQQAQQTQMTMTIVSAVLAQAGGGTDHISKAAELFKTLGILGTKPSEPADDARGGESVGEIISNVADIVHGVVELRQGMPMPSGPPGSAAAVLGSPSSPTPATPIKNPDAA